MYLAVMRKLMVTDRIIKYSKAETFISFDELYLHRLAAPVVNLSQWLKRLGPIATQRC